MNEHACKTRFHLKSSSQMSHSLVRNLFKWPETVYSLTFQLTHVLWRLLLSVVFILLSCACRNLVVVPNPPRILPVTELTKKMRQPLKQAVSANQAWLFLFWMFQCLACRPASQVPCDRLMQRFSTND